MRRLGAGHERSIFLIALCCREEEQLKRRATERGQFDLLKADYAVRR